MLLSLEENRALTFDELARRVKGSRSSTHRALQKLLEYGLIKIDKEEEFPFRVFIELTPVGVEVRRRAADIEKMLVTKRVVEETGKH